MSELQPSDTLHFIPTYRLPSGRLVFLLSLVLTVIVVLSLMQMFQILLLLPMVLLLLGILHTRVTLVEFGDDIKVRYGLGREKTFEYRNIRQVEREFIRFDKGFIGFNYHHEAAQVYIQQESIEQLHDIFDYLFESGKVTHSQLWTKEELLARRNDGIYTVMTALGVSLCIWLGLLLTYQIPSELVLAIPLLLIGLLSPVVHFVRKWVG